MRIEQLKFIPDILIAGSDFARIKIRKSEREIAKEERALSAHMSLVLTVWRLDMRVPLSDLLTNNSHVVWSCMRRWMNVYDDVIDGDKSHYPSVAQLKHYPLLDGSRASDTTSDLVRATCSVPDKKRRRVIFRDLTEFRKREYLLNLELSRELDNGPRTFNKRIEDLKLESSGLAMLYFSRVINTINGIQGERAQLCEDGFYNLGMAGQYVDDLADFERDAGDPTNLVVNASRLFPEEYTFLCQRGYSMKALRHCQSTLGHAEERCRALTSMIPDSLIHTRRSVEFFASIIPFYAAFETKPYV